LEESFDTDTMNEYNPHNAPPHVSRE